MPDKPNGYEEWLLTAPSDRIKLDDMIKFLQKSLPTPKSIASLLRCFWEMMPSTRSTLVKKIRP